VCDVCLLITQIQHRGRKDLGRYGVSIKSNIIIYIYIYLESVKDSNT